MSWWEKLFGPKVPTKDVSQVAQALREGNVVILDIRDEHAYREGHIAGARHVSVHDLLDAIAALPRETPIVVVCRSGNRSVGAAKRLLKAGYPEVYSMKGGMRAWRRAGLPVEKG